MYGWVTLEAARPQTCGKGFHPLHPNRRLSKQWRESKFRLPRWGYGKFEGFWPKKARENPRGKFIFPYGLFPGFPRMLCIRVGGFTAGPEAPRHQVKLPRFSQHQRETGLHF